VSLNVLVTLPAVCQRRPNSGGVDRRWLTGLLRRSTPQPKTHKWQLRIRRLVVRIPSGARLVETAINPQSIWGFLSFRRPPRHRCAAWSWFQRRRHYVSINWVRSPLGPRAKSSTGATSTSLASPSSVISAASASTPKPSLWTSIPRPLPLPRSRWSQRATRLEVTAPHRVRARAVRAPSRLQRAWRHGLLLEQERTAWDYAHATLTNAIQ
jgi:hypothetical protein